LQRRRYHACAFNPEETPMDITIFHNPRCGTSRNTLALIREAGHEPHVVDYLATPPARAELAQMIAQAGLSVREALRSKESLYGELGLDDPATSDDALLDAMLTHPILINRPFVVTPNGVRLCRPAERVREIM
jgi:arsenate reductase